MINIKHAIRYLSDSVGPVSRIFKKNTSIAGAWRFRIDCNAVMPHKAGTISMPRTALGTARGDFFICLEVAPWYDVNPIQPGDNQGYAAFGQVVEGLEVARAIHDLPVSPTEGADYGMAGQILDPPVKFISVKRV